MTYALKPIKDEASYEEALHAIESLMEENPAEGTDHYHLLGALVTLVEHYEEQHFSDWEDDLDPIELIKAYMTDNKKSSKDLGMIIGSQSRASEVLNYKRSLALSHIRNLYEQWHIPLEVLVREYPLKKSNSSKVSHS